MRWASLASISRFRTAACAPKRVRLYFALECYSKPTAACAGNLAQTVVQDGVSDRAEGE